MKCRVLLPFVLVVHSAFGAAASFQKPEPPRLSVDAAYLPPTNGALWKVTASAGAKRSEGQPASSQTVVLRDLQQAFNRARPGDIIELEAGGTFAGNFGFPRKEGEGWIYVRSSRHDDLPPPGTRVRPEQAPLMGRIVSPNQLPALQVAPGAHHVRFVGVEITTTHATTKSTNWNLILVSGHYKDSNVVYARRLEDLSQHIIFDRCYIHGTPTGDVRAGLSFNGAFLALLDSTVSDFHEVGPDSQAVWAWNGAGPYLIQNNYLEGSGENIMFGGTDPVISDRNGPQPKSHRAIACAVDRKTQAERSGLVPSDIVIRGNHFFKPLSWRIGHATFAGIRWTVKNLFELKNARRVLIEGNVLENNWAHAQNGSAILFTVRNQSGTAPWSAVHDVTFTHNIVRNAPVGMLISSEDDIHQSQPTKNVLIQNNLFEGIERHFFLLGSPSKTSVLSNLVIDHNTFLHSKLAGASVAFFEGAGPFSDDFDFTNNLLTYGRYGILGTGKGPGFSTFEVYLTEYRMQKNVFLNGGLARFYPPGNFMPVSAEDAGITDISGGDYRLSEESRYHKAGTDGKDIGADMNALRAATSGAISGK